MSLLTDKWISVQRSGIMEKISLQQLLCEDKDWELCFPRDDMEFACLQLLVAILQVLFTPKDKKEWIKRIKHPLTPAEYEKICAGKENSFDLDHPDAPFMQTRNIKADKSTSIDTIMAGVAKGTNKSFVNPLGLVKGLCSGCVAIALYNTAYNCPSAGGGFKSGMRGSTPITVLIRGETLRETLWLNVLTQENLQKMMPWHEETSNQPPGYVQPIKAKEEKYASSIGLTTGLFWQPAHIELCKPVPSGICSCCGEKSRLFTHLKQEKFVYTIKGIWPHPLSSRTFTTTKGKKEEKFPSFTTNQPGWVHLTKLIVDRQEEKDGYTPVPVITQFKSFGAKRLDIIIGGYRNKQAAILERRHEFFTLAEGWHDKTNIVEELIKKALDYKKALRKALYMFKEGIKDRFSGTGINLMDEYDHLFYQQTEISIHDALAEIHFDHPEETQDKLYDQLCEKVKSLFNQAVASYQQEPKMLKALAWSKRTLNKSLKELKPTT